jgi:hypothetical protein
MIKSSMLYTTHVMRTHFSFPYNKFTTALRFSISYHYISYLNEISNTCRIYICHFCFHNYFISFAVSIAGLPCPLGCDHCYKDKKPDDCFAFDLTGNPLPCPQIDANITLATAQNETTDAKGTYLK